MIPVKTVPFHVGLSIELLPACHLASSESESKREGQQNKMLLFFFFYKHNFNTYIVITQLAYIFVSFFI